MRGLIGFTQPFFPRGVRDVFLDRSDGDSPMAGLSITQLPSHRRSCGQMRPQISGKVLVACDTHRLLASALQLSDAASLGCCCASGQCGLAIRHAALAAPAGLLRGFGVIRVFRVDLVESPRAAHPASRFSRHVPLKPLFTTFKHWLLCHNRQLTAVDNRLVSLPYASTAKSIIKAAVLTYM